MTPGNCLAAADRILNGSTAGALPRVGARLIRLALAAALDRYRRRVGIRAPYSSASGWGKGRSRRGRSKTDGIASVVFPVVFRRRRT